MRPLKLRLSNFASFRGDGVELDFTPLELFAIAGPTGAGKSSLLDAMIFALYGRVPRIGGRGAAEMISLGAARMSVGLDFRVGADAYRVTRVARRRGAATAQLEQLGADGEARPLKASVREVDGEILRLVGLSLDAFTQAVVLPQGEFQKFLKSAPRDRREILSRILRLQIYERMRELAARRRDHFSQAVQQAERRLAEDYADATAENLAALNVRATDLGAKIEALSGRLDEAVTRRNALQIARAKTRELEQRRARLVQLEAEEPKIRAAEARLDAARRAAPVIPLITAARTAETRAAEAERLYAAAARQHAQTRSRRETAKKRLAQTTKEADEIPQLVERIALLDQILGRMRPRPGLVKDLAEAGKQQAETARKLEEAHNANQKAAVGLATARQRVLEAEAALVAVRFDSSLFEILDATRDEASRIANLRAEVARRGAEVRSATDQLKQRETTLSAATRTAEKVGKDWGRAAQGLQAIDTQCSEARHRASAALLRRELRLGEPCPVCAQPVAEHPPALATPALDALEHKFERLQTAEAEARDCMEKARIAAAGAAAAVAAARDNLDQSTGRLNAADTELAGKRQALGESVGGHLAISADKPIEEQVQDDWRLLAAARRRHETVREARDNAERAVHGGEREEQRLGATVHQLSESLSQQQIRVAEITRQIADIDAEVRRVTQAPDPRAERAALDGRRTGLERALQECQVADGQTATELAAASASLEGSEKARRMAQEDARRASEAARTEAAAAGFPDAVAAAGAELGAPKQQRIGEQVRTHRDERRTVDARIGELVGELQGKEVAQETLDAAQNAALDLANDLADTRDSRARLDEQMHSLTEKIARAEELQKELESQREEHAVYRDLALDLRNDRFQAFLLEERSRP